MKQSYSWQAGTVPHHSIKKINLISTGLSNASI